jgi:hypothetical protein
MATNQQVQAYAVTVHIQTPDKVRLTIAVTGLHRAPTDKAWRAA